MIIMKSVEHSLESLHHSPAMIYKYPLSAFSSVCFETVLVSSDSRVLFVSTVPLDIQTPQACECTLRHLKLK